MAQYNYSELSKEDKKIQLYLKQKELLNQFLKTGAISKAQYNKSLGDLTIKMDMQKFSGDNNERN